MATEAAIDKCIERFIDDVIEVIDCEWCERRGQLADDCCYCGGKGSIALDHIDFYWIEAEFLKLNLLNVRPAWMRCGLYWIWNHETCDQVYWLVTEVQAFRLHPERIYAIAASMNRRDRENRWNVLCEFVRFLFGMGGGNGSRKR